jgi:hypothetical protein
MTILERVKTELESYREQHGSASTLRAPAAPDIPSGLAVVLGRKEASEVELEATPEFLSDRESGQENLAGLPIVRIDHPSYFAIEVA